MALVRSSGKYPVPRELQMSPRKPRVEAGAAGEYCEGLCGPDRDPEFQKGMGLHPHPDRHCTYVRIPLPSLLAALHSVSRCFSICSFHMQSSNCTAYFAPEVGMSVLVNTLFPLLPCYCVSPHCKTGAAQSIFPVVCPLKSQPQKDTLLVRPPPADLAYISLRSPSFCSARGPLSPPTNGSFCYSSLLLWGPLVCTMDSF